MYIHTYIHIHSAYLSLIGHLGCLHGLAVVNNGATNREYKCDFNDFISSGYILRSGIAGSYGSSVFLEEPPYCFPYWL